MLLTWIFVFFLSCASSYAANDGFPAKLRGLWGDTKETCDSLRKDVPESLYRESWLKITATNVLGSTQGRFFREIPAQSANGVAAELSSEMQALDEPGLIITLTLSVDGRLYKTIGGAREPGNYQRC